MDHSIQETNQIRGRREELAIRAFQIDPGWYEAHWLTQPGPRPLSSIRRIAAGFWAVVVFVIGFRIALSELPSETLCPQSDFRIDVLCQRSTQRGDLNVCTDDQVR
jgi:hypothetical protein